MSIFVWSSDILNFIFMNVFILVLLICPSMNQPLYSIHLFMYSTIYPTSNNLLKSFLCIYKLIFFLLLLIKNLFITLSFYPNIFLSIPIYIAIPLTKISLVFFNGHYKIFQKYYIIILAKLILINKQEWQRSSKLQEIWGQDKHWQI